jgi:hypothetical protein
MRTQDPKPGERYGFVRRWCQYMGSYEPYTQRQLEMARAERAPAHAVYPKTIPKTGERVPGQWVTIDEIQSEAAVHYLYNGDHINNSPQRTKAMGTNGVLL